MEDFERERYWHDSESWAAPGRYKPPTQDEDRPREASNSASCAVESQSSTSGGSRPSNASRRRSGAAGRRGSIRGNLPLSCLAVLLLAVALSLSGGLDGSDDAVGALSFKGPEGSSTSLPPSDEVLFPSTEAAAATSQNSNDAGTRASSRASCPSGYYLFFGGLACAKVESRAATLSCPSGSSQFSLGIGAAWGCRKDLGAASTSYSCSQGTLAWRAVSSVFARVCKITSTSVESQNASASCTPRGTPSTCRYTTQTRTRQSQGASASCTPRGTPSTCRYTTQTRTRQSQGASASCTPRGTPSTCRYTTQTRTRQSQSASLSCSPRGAPTFCRYSVRQSTSATYRYVPGVGGYYYCSSGWTRSGSTCYRYVIRNGTLGYSCPSGWSRSGSTCYRYITNTVTRYGTLNYSCPSSWTRSGSTCYRYITNTVTRYGTLNYSCPSSWTRSGSTCYRYITNTVTRYGTLNYSCPSSWTRSGSTCRRTVTTVRYTSPSSSRSCSTGTLVSGRCWSYPAKVKSCPKGWTLRSGSCKRTLYASPTYTYSCPQGRTLRRTRCYTTATTTTTAATTTATTTTSTTTTTTTTATASTTTTTANLPASPQVGTTTTTTTLTCTSPAVRVVALGCVAAPEPPPNLFVLGGPNLIRVFWQSSGNSGGAGVTISSYRVLWRTADAAATGEPFRTAATVTPSRQGLEFFERMITGFSSGVTITGLTNGDEYHVRVEVISSATNPTTGNPFSSTTRTYGAVPRANAPDGGWQPYQLPEEKTASLNERTRRGEPLRVCTSAPDFVATINAAVNAWNDALNPTGSNFQDVFTFSNTVSHPTACGEERHPQRRDAPRIIPNANFDIVISDYRCTPPTPPATGTCAAPAVQEECLPLEVRHLVSIPPCSFRRCTDLRANARYCASRNTLCSGVALGCVWPRILNHTGDDPRLVDGSAIQIVAYNRGSDVALFAHELGHLLGLDDYGFQCAWEDRPTGIPPNIQTTSRKHPSLFSYNSGPRSWRALIANPSLHTANYLDCRSPDITTRDEEDFRAIYRPKRFTNNRFVSETVNRANVWRLEFGYPPTDVNPTATGGRSKVYNAYQWLILHRAPNPGRQPNADCTYSGPYATLRADTRDDTTSGTSNNRLLAFTLEQLTDTGEMDDLGSLQDDHFRLNTNFDTTALREHQFIIVGITRGDPLADDTLPLGTEKSVVNLDLNGDGVVEEWTLGEPSIPFRTRPCNSTSTPISPPSTTTPVPAP